MEDTIIVDEQVHDYWCDEILKILCSHIWSYNELNLQAIKEQLQKAGHICNDKQVFVMLSILYTEELITFSPKDLEAGKVVTHTLTFRGMAFVKTDSYVERGKRWELEKKLKQQQVTLNTLELAIKPSTFYLAILGFIISLIALVISVFHK